MTEPEPGEGAGRPVWNRSMTPLPRSLPAFACALRMGALPNAESRAAFASLNQLAQVYRVSSNDPESEAAGVAHAVTHAVDRLGRLRGAYSEWGHFDAAAYFDLTRAQADLFITVVERATTVAVTFHTDLLIPSFRAALRAWMRAGKRESPYALDLEHFEHWATSERAAVDSAWRQALQVVEHAREALFADVGYLAASDGIEERWRWSRVVAQAADVRFGAVPFAVATDPASTPTLIVATEFPLPIWRQPDRARRLRRNRDRRARNRNRAG